MSDKLGKRQTRCRAGEFRATTADDGNLYIEGYFAVFNSDYNIGPGMSESIAPGAFDETISGDIRCLTDHETRLVVGRTTAGTFDVKVDSHGLYGRALVNPKDQDAVNTHARVQRGDVTQASIGFDILDEESEYRNDGSVHWTIKKIKLYECSICTFPAYEETNLNARSAQKANIEKRKAEKWKHEMTDRLARRNSNKE